MVAHVDKVGADMAQLNVTVEEHILTAGSACLGSADVAARAGAGAADEALAADLVGRPLFAQPEAPPAPAIDPATLITLTGHLDS
jgi:hypothetical protein